MNTSPHKQSHYLQSLVTAKELLDPFELDYVRNRSDKYSLIKDTIEAFRNGQRTRKKEEPIPEPGAVFARLNYDSQARLHRTKALEESLAHSNSELPSQPKMNPQQAEAVVNRLHTNGQRQRMRLELQRKAEQESEERARTLILEAKHPKRKLSQEVQNRLLQESKTIEKLYGKPRRRYGNTP